MNYWPKLQLPGKNGPELGVVFGVHFSAQVDFRLDPNSGLAISSCL